MESKILLTTLSIFLIATITQAQKGSLWAVSQTHKLYYKDMDSSSWTKTAITVNGIQYTSSARPSGGVTILYTTGTGPTQSINLDPVDGLVSMVIPFAAIDNAGKENATLGSITLTYTAILSTKSFDFSATENDGKINLYWKVSNELNVKFYDRERSVNGIDFNKIGTVNYDNNTSEKIPVC